MKSKSRLHLGKEEMVLRVEEEKAESPFEVPMVEMVEMVEVFSLSLQKMKIPSLTINTRKILKLNQENQGEPRINMEHMEQI